MVDSYRFLNGVGKRVMQHWSSLRAFTPIPWTPLAKPLSHCMIALVSSSALAINNDRPFDLQIERVDPWNELETLGAYKFGGKLVDSMTAHPKVCPSLTSTVSRQRRCGALCRSRCIETVGK